MAESASAGDFPSDGRFTGGMATEEDEDEDLCRICRGPNELENPLRYPCACRGSMKYVHQECLLLWLDRRQISSCEVCRHLFSYTPVYAHDAPSRLPLKEFVVGLASKVFHFLGIFQHYGSILLVWLVAVPIVTHWIWEFSFFKGFSEARNLFTRHLTLAAILADCLHGSLLSLGMAYIFMVMTCMRVLFLEERAWIPGIVNEAAIANTNGENAGGRQAIVKILLITPRIAAFLCNWWRVLVVRIVVCFGIVEVEHLNNIINEQAPFFPFNENAFAVVTSNTVLTFTLVLLPFCLGKIATPYRSWIFSFKRAHTLVAPEIESARLEVLRARNILDATKHFLSINGADLSTQIFEEDSKALGIVSDKLYKISQPNDNTTLLIGYMVILSFVVLYLGAVIMMRYLRGEPLKLQTLSGMIFRIDAVLSPLVKDFFRLLKQTVKMVSRNFFSILKVAILLGMKAVVFPMMCGLWLDVCMLKIFGHTFAMRIEFFRKYPVLMSLAHWILGILYLMYVFLHVNLLQEVLQNEVVHFLPKISEPRDFFRQMIDCSVFKCACNFLVLVGVHGSLIVLLLFLPIKLVMLCVPSAFPVRFFFPESKTAVAEILRRTLVQMGTPPAFRLYYPSRTFEILLWKWLSVTCKLLGLSNSLLARHENYDAHAEQIRRQNVLPLSAFAIMEGSIVWLHKPMNICYPQEAVNQFGARVTLLLIWAWMTSIVYNSLLMTVPLVLGRTVFQAASNISPELKQDDFCSFIFGSCLLRAIISCAEFSAEHIQSRGARAFLSILRKYFVSLFKFCGPVALEIFILPTSVGFLLDLLPIVPVKLPLHLALLKYWGVGGIFLITFLGLAMIDFMYCTGQRWSVKLHRVIADIHFHWPDLSTMVDILVPMMIVFLVALSAPNMAARVFLTTPGYSLPNISLIDRFLWPACFSVGVVWLCIKTAFTYVVALHNKIRDDRYCVGRRLQDFGEGARVSPNWEIEALELRG